MNNNMKKNVVWLVRDARGLSVYEKSFLFVVASRGLAKTYRKTLMEDMGGISTGMLSKVVASLREKDLIEVHEGFWQDGKKSQTVYTIKEDVLATFVPARGERSQDELEGSHDEQGGSSHEQGGSQDERGRSPHGGYKETVKETKKVTSKETTRRVTAPVTPSKVKDDSPTPSLPNSSKTPSLQETRSVASLQERKVAQGRSNDRGRDWLETLIKKERLEEQDADRARALYEDPTWRAEEEGVRRAAIAMFDSKPVAVAPVREVATPTSTEDSW